MPNILFPHQDVNSTHLPASSPEYGVLARFNALDCTKMRADMPYCSSAHPCGLAITQSLSSLTPQARQNLLHTVDNFGHQTSVLADIYQRHFASLELQPLASLAGATASSMDNRLTALQKALLQYQETLVRLRNHKATGREASARRAELRNQVKARFATLQKEFKLELKKMAPAAHIGKNRGSALTSAERGLTLAAQRRDRQLYVADGKQANNLKKMATGTRYVGNGMVVLDAGFRAREVQRMHSSGGNWQREASVQATGFGLGTAVGIGTGKAVVGGLIAIGLGATPVGWVVLIGLGAGVGFAAANIFDKAGKSFAASLWDRARQ